MTAVDRLDDEVAEAADGELWKSMPPLTTRRWTAWVAFCFHPRHRKVRQERVKPGLQRRRTRRNPHEPYGQATHTVAAVSVVAPASPTGARDDQQHR